MARTAPRRWIRTLDQYERLSPILKQTPLVRGSTGQPALNPLASYVAMLGRWALHGGVPAERLTDGPGEPGVLRGDPGDPRRPNRDAILKCHVENVTADQKPRGWRMSKPVGSTRKIDAAIAAAIALYCEQITQPPEDFSSIYERRGLLVFD